MANCAPGNKRDIHWFMFKVNAHAHIEKLFVFCFLHMLSYTICWHMIYQQMLGGRLVIRWLIGWCVDPWPLHSASKSLPQVYKWVCVNADLFRSSWRVSRRTEAENLPSLTGAQWQHAGRKQTAHAPTWPTAQTASEISKSAVDKLARLHL